MLVRGLELQAHYQFFALVQDPVHLFNTLDGSYLRNQVVDFSGDIRVKVEGILCHLEGDASTLREFDAVVQLISQVFEVVRFGTRVF